MHGGYAAMFVGVFLALSGLVVLGLFLARAATFARTFAGENLLAHWTCSTVQAQQHAAAALAEYRERNRALFLITAVLIVVIGVPVLVIPLWDDLAAGRDPIVLIIVGGYFLLIPLLGLVAWLMPRLAYRRALQDGGDVYITREGVFVNGAFHTWKQPFAELRQVRFDQKAEPPALEFDIRYLTRVGVVHDSTTTLRVPVPLGEDKQAENVARFFVERDD
jgi:hypothetical protein